MALLGAAQRAAGQYPDVDDPMSAAWRGPAGCRNPAPDSRPEPPRPGARVQEIVAGLRGVEGVRIDHPVNAAVSPFAVMPKKRNLPSARSRSKAGTTSSSTISAVKSAPAWSRRWRCGTGTDRPGRAAAASGSPRARRRSPRRSGRAPVGRQPHLGADIDSGFRPAARARGCARICRCHTSARCRNS